MLIAWKVHNIRPDYVPQLTAIFQINITNLCSYDVKHENCCCLGCDASVFFIYLWFVAPIL